MKLTFLDVGGDFHAKPLTPETLVTSTTIDITGSDDFFTVLCGYAARDARLVNGNIIKDLNNEAWGDNYNQYSQLPFIAIDTLEALPPELSNTTHIKQTIGDITRYFFLLDTMLPAHALIEYIDTIPNITSLGTTICFGEDPILESITKNNKLGRNNPNKYLDLL